jgi:hypothetical protein
MADDIARVLPAHGIFALTAQAALEPAVDIVDSQEGAVDLAALAIQIPAALVLVHLAHERIHAEPAREDLLDGGECALVGAVVTEVGERRREVHCARGGAPGLPHAPRKPLRRGRVVARCLVGAFLALAAGRARRGAWRSRHGRWQLYRYRRRYIGAAGLLECGHEKVGFRGRDGVRKLDARAMTLFDLDCVSVREFRRAEWRQDVSYLSSGPGDGWVTNLWHENNSCG